MRASNLPSARGFLSSSHALRIELAKAISQVEVASKRSSVGYGAGAAALVTMLNAARVAADRADRAASIAITPTTATVSTNDRRRTPTSVVATSPLGNATTVFSASTATVTLTGQPANGNNVIIAGVTYTFQTALTNVAGNVLIGADANATAANLVAAINQGAGSGTVYAAATVRHPVAYASAAAAVVTVTLWGVNPSQGGDYAVSRVGANITVPATGVFTTGVFDARVTFASGTPAAATVGVYGQVSWVATGSSVITASYHGRTATLTVTAS
jgi:hypothetical protein